MCAGVGVGVGVGSSACNCICNLYPLLPYHTTTPFHFFIHRIRGPGSVGSPEGVEELGNAGQRDAASLASSDPCSLAARSEVDGMSHASSDNVPYGSSQPQNTGGAYRHTHIGFLPDASSVDSISNCDQSYRPTVAGFQFGGPSISTSSTTSHISENGTPLAYVESSEGEQLSGVVSTGVADSGTAITSDHGAAGESESTFQTSTRTRTPGNGCTYQ